MSYVSAVADLFEALGHPELLTATAYTTFAEWEKEGIPLDLVSTSINEVSLGTVAQGSFPQICELVETSFAEWLSFPPNAATA